MYSKRKMKTIQNTMTSISTELTQLSTSQFPIIHSFISEILIKHELELYDEKRNLERYSEDYEETASHIIHLKKEIQELKKEKRKIELQDSIYPSKKCKR